jgi:hypothetical protein
MRKRLILVTVAALAGLTTLRALVAPDADTALGNAELLAARPPQFSSTPDSAATLVSREFRHPADESDSSLRQIAAKMAEEQVVDYTHVFVARPEPVASGVLEAISEWLAKEFDLPPSALTPHIELISSTRMGELRYSKVLALQPGSERENAMAVTDLGQEVLALYDNANEFIYLQKGWTGRSSAEMSVLVHELVHHLQNQGKIKHSCPQEREKLAYAAQERWLNHFGTSLEKEFGIDPFTLLVKINCFG